jgi:hypothetical protein
MVNTWFVMIPPSYASSSTAEKELVDFVIQYQAGSPAWNDANAGRIVQGAEGNTGNPQVSEQLIKWLGPFATQAQAHTAAAPRQQSPNPVNDAVNALENAKTPLDFFKDLFTRENAIRLAEGILGLTLILVAVAKLGEGTAVGKLAKKVPFI